MLCIGDVVVICFQNQLNNREINQGLAVYFGRSFWPFSLLVLLLAFAFFYSNGNGLINAAIGAAATALLGAGFVFLALRQQLSPDKIAIYKLHEHNLEIISSTGSVHHYNYDKIQSISAKNVIVLRLSRVSFTIVAKRNIPKEQSAFLGELPHIISTR